MIGPLSDLSWSPRSKIFRSSVYSMPATKHGASPVSNNHHPRLTREPEPRPWAADMVSVA